MNNNIFVVIPVFNEGETLYKVLSEIKDIIYDAKIVIVDDGSDPPVRIINKKNMVVIRHEENRGYGAAIFTGMRFAIENSAEIILTLDSDGQHFPRRIPYFIKEIEKYDFVSGSRYLPGSPKLSLPPVERKIINMVVTEILRELTRYDITDSFCGFRAYRSEILEEFYPVDKGYAFPIELWHYMYVMRAKYTEIPVELYYPVKKDFPGILKYSDKRLRYYLEAIEKNFKVSVLEKGLKIYKKYKKEMK